MNASVMHKSQHVNFDLLQAKDLMVPNPVSIRHDASIREALELLTDRGFGAAPVIDEAGRSIGVVSRTDILIHERECVRHARTSVNDWDLLPDPSWSDKFSIEVTDPTSVGEIMTPAIFSVARETPAREVVRRMLELKVHHLFVSDDEAALIGVISPIDIMRRLAY